MISFTMNVLNYNPTGSYSVEYIPEKVGCTPIKLNIQLDQKLIVEGDKDTILNRLRASSPQDFWERELSLMTSTNFNPASLINTTHAVDNPVATNIVTGDSTPQFDPLDNAVNQLPRVGNSTPEQQATFEAQQRIKLKLIIQEVIEEMAEGTI